VSPGVRIGRWSTLGAGAVAIRDVADGVVAVGVPAAALKG
jgi:acetyltransferase EpsM